MVRWEDTDPPAPFVSNQGRREDTDPPAPLVLVQVVVAVSVVTYSVFSIIISLHMQLHE